MIGLATDSTLPELSGGEQLLYRELLRRTECKVVIWDDPQESWRECSEIIIRTTWDYGYHLPEFLSWIAQVKRAGIRLHNSAEIIRWNCDKKYMCELAARGVSIPETHWIPRGTLTQELLESLVTEPCVIKPTVSGGAKDTYRISPDSIREVAEQLKQVAIEKDLMLQSFIPEITNPGEYSLIFFRNEFSHAVLKTPAAGDYRVQSKFGGLYQGMEVSSGTIEQARFVLDQIPFVEAPLYARVDGILRDGKFILMELELIEPYLFLEFGDSAATLLASKLSFDN